MATDANMPVPVKMVPIEGKGPTGTPKVGTAVPSNPAAAAKQGADSAKNPPK
jgi:hypothetical protein